MGYYIKNLPNSENQISEYIGSQTIYAVADSGAFDSPVSPELEEYVNNNENVIAVVDSNGVEHFLNTLKNNTIKGRDYIKLIQIVEEKLNKGFIIIT